VTVHRFEQRWRDGDRACFVIECSTGTYVRSLIADLHDGYCVELRRTAIGPFTVDDADGETVMPLGDVLAAILPVVALNGEDARRASHGATIGRGADGPVVLADDSGPICVAEPLKDGVIKPVVGFRG
jgi:tRNA pseudouridine55 synthase